MKEKFADILDYDEEIIKVIKPIKSRYWKQFIIPFCLPIFWPHLIFMMAITLFTLPIFVAKSYNNLYYAYTNKRLIVRHGTFGVSFASLDYKDITATSVNVGAFDKKHNTGTLTFSGPGFYERRPMNFEFIEDPYEEMKSIKEYIDIAKN